MNADLRVSARAGSGRGGMTKGWVNGQRRPPQRSKRRTKRREPGLGDRKDARVGLHGDKRNETLRAWAAKKASGRGGRGLYRSI